MNKAEILEQALALTDSEREELANELLDSLPGNGAVSQNGWTAELEARIQSVESGQVQLQDWEAARGQLHAASENRRTQ